METEKAYAGNIPVYCSFDQIVATDELRPNPKNPNTHPGRQIELLASIIMEQGWRKPITVSTRSGMVVSGHGRLLAAQFAGLPFVPVDFQHYDSDEAELQDLLADNRIAELSEADDKMLAKIFAELDADEVDLSLTGYNDEEIARISAALDEAVMLDIDQVKSKSEVSTHKMRIDHTVLELTDEEYTAITEALDNYIDMNGTSFGFVRWLFSDN